MTATEQAVKERPILFSAPMVRAILEGRKTQTRRIVKPQPQPPYGYDSLDPTHPIDYGVRWENPGDGSKGPPGMWTKRCPYGKPGDRLWVRETWSIEAWGTGYEITYRADRTHRELLEGRDYTEDADPWCRYYDTQVGDWRPSIHMPRAASRILLEVVSVRVEHLNDINEEDALADGGWEYRSCPVHKSPVRSFADLWESINGKKSWDANPWVWVVEFRRL